MNRHLYILLLFLVGCAALNAQEVPVNWLDEVVLSDVKLKTNSEGQLVRKLSDSIIEQNEPFLVSLLKFNTPYFFRENGYGGVASASIRGTGAAQTAVVWNGININSQLTGQTDFNTVNTGVFDNISIRPGGGSVVYGSGAIGGTIHLNNKFQFDRENDHSIFMALGSFDTYQASYNGNFSNDKTSLNLGMSGITSENDFVYPGTEITNENGDFENLSLNVSLAHWISDTNILKFYSNYYSGDRAFSGTINLPSNSFYEDRNSRNLLEWKSFFGKLTSSFKIAWLQEEFKYFENRDSENHSFGKAGTGILKYDLGIEISENKNLNFIADYTNIQGEGSGILNADREIGGFSALWNHDLEKFTYEFSLRQEITSDYSSPLLFSVGGNYRFSDIYLLRFSASRNFRIPSINDLFWQAGGNQELDPETSLQYELGNEFKLKDFEFNLTGFFMDITDLIRWVPDSSGLWRPVNTASVHNFGLEFFGGWAKTLDEHKIDLSASYAFTKSINQETQKQLIYTPEHKLTFSGGYEIKKISAFFQSFWNGSIYTSSDNQYELDPYALFNLGLGYRLMDKPEIFLQAQVNNLFDENYQSLPGRIMPGRSIRTTIKINF
ncbi:TonB-dependent receptor [Gramella sp. BOM4]|nr:TonB-dependent receptor [Christiangramia bathymodioli]